MKILQIIPAEHYYAIYASVKPEATGNAFSRRLVSWALVEIAGGETEVIGLTDGGKEIEPANQPSNFLGYSFHQPDFRNPNHDFSWLKSWEDEAKAWQKRNAACELERGASNAKVNLQ